MKNYGLKIYNIIVIFLLLIGNLMHLYFTYYLTSEQLNTYWGFGSMIELGALYVWIVELLCLPIIVLTGIYFICCSVKNVGISYILPASFILGILILQFFFSNLFMYY